MERLLVHTIYIRTKNRLNEIKTELQTIVKNIDCKYDLVSLIIFLKK